MIHNKKYTFGLHPLFLAQTSQNPWTFPSDESSAGVSCCVDEETFGPHLRMMAGCLGNQPCDPPAWQPGRGKVLAVKSITSGQWFNQLCLCDEASITGRKDVVRELAGWWTHGDGESGALGEGMEAPHPFPTCCSMHLFHLALPKLYLFIINWSPRKLSVSLSSVSDPSKLIKPKEREPPIYIPSEAQVTVWTCD